MPETLLRSWTFLGNEVYRPLADHEYNPPTLDVFAAIGEVLQEKVEKARFDITLREEDEEDYFRFSQELEALQDEDRFVDALDVLCGIKLPGFVSDLVVMDYLEAVHDLLANEYDDQWGVLFAENVTVFVRKYNLAYKVHRPFEIMPLITSELGRIYELVQSIPGNDGDLHHLWSEFEAAYSQLIKGGGDTKTPLSKAIIFLEAFAGDHVKQRGKTLGDVLKFCERKSLFPHKKTISDSLRKLYGFTSDYPGIRHAGNPSSITRPLTDVDTTFISLMFFVWAGYVRSLTLNDNAVAVEPLVL